MKHTITIQWSEADQCYVVFLPEFVDLAMQPVTHGDTYEEALGHAQEVLEMFIDIQQRQGKNTE